MTDPLTIGIVIIGRNEGPRLDGCILSAKPHSDRIVYVDSGSTDGSVSLARGHRVPVVELSPDLPFTAARARNAGFAELRARGPVDAVQFLDGDCVLQPDWLAVASRVLARQSNVAVLAGRVREQAPSASIYNRLCDQEWRALPGPVLATGGNALIRAEALLAVGGFVPELIAGEEPELCLRLRRASWRILQLRTEMVLHDAEMTRFSQWALRCKRSGWAYASGAQRHGRGPERYCRRDLWRIWAWGAAVPGVLALTFAIWFVQGGGVASIALGAMLCLPLVQTLRIARMRRRVFGENWRSAARYAVFTLLGKFPQLVGVMSHGVHRLRGASGELIEYRAALSTRHNA